MIKGKNKYIQRYPEPELIHILKNSGYYSSEWEETDPEDEMDPDENNRPIEDVVKEKQHHFTFMKNGGVLLQYVYNIVYLLFYLFY